MILKLLKNKRILSVKLFIGSVLLVFWLLGCDLKSLVFETCFMGHASARIALCFSTAVLLLYFSY